MVEQGAPLYAVLARGDQYRTKYLRCQKQLCPQPDQRLYALAAWKGIRMLRYSTNNTNRYTDGFSHGKLSKPDHFEHWVRTPTVGMDSYF